MIEIKNIAHSYLSEQGEIRVFENFSCTLAENELTAVIGPSGCGKSTLLRLIAGLETPRSGMIAVNGVKPIPGMNDTAMVFQHHALFPWMKTVDNVLFGVKSGSKKEQFTKAMDLLDRFGLADFAKRMPHELSGGMAQRVSIARSLANSPKILLMDEPFSALDEKLRRELQDELLSIRSEMNLTIIYVTHSIDEAIYLADRSVVITHRPAQIAGDLEIALEHPRDRSSEQFESQVIALRRHLMTM